MIKKFFSCFLILFLLASCNYGLFIDDVPRYDGNSSRFETVAFFDGSSPRNLVASKADFSDRIAISFDAVPGADYYGIYFAEVLRSDNVADYDSLEWKQMENFIADTGADIYQVVHTIDSSKGVNYKYYYKVKAFCSNSFSSIREGEYSAVAVGWTLSPPVSLKVSQGQYTDRIYLEWDQVDTVRGYNIYYTSNKEADSSTWTVLEKDIPAPYGVETITAVFNNIPEAYLGKDIFFAIESVSYGNSASLRSGIRNGYTFVEGAPEKPTGVSSSYADSPTEISISWDKAKREDNTEYTWQVFRNTPNSSSEQIFEFSTSLLASSNEYSSGGRTVRLEDGKYVLVDNTSAEDNPISANIVTDYEYSIRALCDIKTEVDGVETVSTGIGESAIVTGRLLLPPTDISVSIRYPSGSDKGGFDFTITTPPGYAADKDWVYNIWARHNNGTDVGNWNVIESVAVPEGSLSYSVDYATQPYNEFTFSIINGDSLESLRYDEISGRSAFAPDKVDLDSISLLSNTYNPSLTAGENGVYPVWISIAGKENYKTIHFEVQSGETVTKYDLLLADLEKASFALPFSPENPFETVSVRYRGESYFGRFTKWSDFASYYGALAPEKFIKMFEAYSLKPWEFVAYDWFPADLKTKWNSSRMHTMIDAHDTSSVGSAEESASGYPGGKINYNSKIGSGLSGDVTFTYSNFGEVEGIYSNGSYSMKGVSLQGNGSDVSGVLTVSGMYPATVDFSGLSVSGYAFVGSYRLTQENGSGTVSVVATRNE